MHDTNTYGAKIHFVLNYFIPLALAGMWFYSSWDKLLNPEGFYWILNNYRVFPDVIQGLAALCFPVFELLLGLMLLIRYRLKEVYLITSLIMVFFILLLSLTYLRGIDLNCGCFDLSENNSNLVFRIFEDLVILVIAMIGFYSHRQIEKTKFEN